MAHDHTYLPPHDALSSPHYLEIYYSNLRNIVASCYERYFFRDITDNNNGALHAVWIESYFRPLPSRPYSAKVKTLLLTDEKFIQFSNNIDLYYFKVADDIRCGYPSILVQTFSESLYALYTSGLEWCYRSLTHEEIITRLLNRASMALLARQYKSAARDVYQILQMDPKNEEVLEISKQLRKANAITEPSDLALLGLDPGPQRPVEQSENRIAGSLPLEIWAMILKYFPVGDRVRMMTVCKSFYRSIQFSLQQETAIDFGASRWPVSSRVFWKVIHECGPQLQHLTIDGLMYEDMYKSICLLRNIEEEPKYESIELKNLTSLTILHACAALDYLLIHAQEPLHRPMFAKFNQLTQLTIPLEEPRDVVETLMLGDLVNLRELNLVLQYNPARRRRSPIDVFSELIKPNYRHPNLIILRMGGLPFLENADQGFQYTALNDPVSISNRLINSLLRMAHRLKEFKCTFLDVRHNFEQIRPFWETMPNLTPDLESIDLSYSTFPTRLVVVPRACKAVILRYTVFNLHPLQSFSIVKPSLVIAADQMEVLSEVSVDTGQHLISLEGIEQLCLAGSTLWWVTLIRSVAASDCLSLKYLDMSDMSLQKFGSLWKDGLVRHPEPIVAYWFKQIVERLPNLQVLRLAMMDEETGEETGLESSWRYYGTNPEAEDNLAGLDSVVPGVFVPHDDVYRSRGRDVVGLIIRYLRRLQVLDLSHFNTITTEKVERLITEIPSLRQVVLYYCPKVDIEWLRTKYSRRGVQLVDFMIYVEMEWQDLLWNATNESRNDAVID
ncbi:uncharacterized protein V1516DRAFT_713680 [Lipomyces oligophaga]|uniref:uncharacterized protein n=1 Tax=Lipomyces oligophaga TaxID=45792 RepID=UPI0034CD5657